MKDWRIDIVSAVTGRVVATIFVVCPTRQEAQAIGDARAKKVGKGFVARVSPSP